MFAGPDFRRPGTDGGSFGSRLPVGSSERQFYGPQLSPLAGRSPGGGLLREVAREAAKVLDGQRAAGVDAKMRCGRPCEWDQLFGCRRCRRQANVWVESDQV